MLFHIDANSSTPIYRQLEQQVREAIVCGRLSGGDRLPSLREVAAELVVNPLTVKQAYGQLEREGLIETSRGRGTFVRGDGGKALRRRVERQLHGGMAELAGGARRAGMQRREFLKLAGEAWDTAEGAR